MKKFALIFVWASIALNAGFTNADGYCKSNETIGPCGPVCEPTCANPDPGTCKSPCIMNTCHCKVGYLRDEFTEECVLAKDCLPPETVRTVDICGKGAAQSACGPLCEPSCNDPNPSTCIDICIANGCRCKDGFLRDWNTGSCVRGENCTDFSLKPIVRNEFCGANAAPAPCGRQCEPTCFDRESKGCLPAGTRYVGIPVFRTNACIVNGCRCNEGFFRDTNTGLCVKREDCSKPESGMVAIDRGCGPFASQTTCGPVCEPTCTNPEPKSCPPNSCIENGCRCRFGTLRNEEDGTCVYAENCPGPDEEITIVAIDPASIDDMTETQL